MNARITRRAFLGFGGSALLGYAHGSFLLPALSSDVNDRQVPLPGLERPVRFANLTDWHSNHALLPQYTAALEKHAGDLDFMILTGDIVDSHDETPKESIMRLKNALPKIPLYFCLGNHDYRNIQVRKRLGTDAISQEGFAGIKEWYQDILFPAVMLAENPVCLENVLLLGYDEYTDYSCESLLKQGQGFNDSPILLFTHEPDPYPLLAAGDRLQESRLAERVLYIGAGHVHDGGNSMAARAAAYLLGTCADRPFPHGLVSGIYRIDEEGTLTGPTTKPLDPLWRWPNPVPEHASMNPKLFSKALLEEMGQFGDAAMPEYRHVLAGKIVDIMQNGGYHLAWDYRTVSKLFGDSCPQLNLRTLVPA